MKMSLYALFLALVIVWVFPMGVQAANEKQEECFGYLKSSILAVPAFSSIHDEVGTLEYKDIQAQLSDYYKNISSFGVDLRSPDFDMRISTFGRETGYQHPPFSPFPTDTLSDKWKEPAKEYIYAEEYIRNAETNERIFISCALMSIENINLKGVTAEKYLYDGPLSSVLFTDPENKYKVWYSNNDSYDHEGRNFVNWRRIFVYPKSTSNQFFDKYTVADAFPARITTNLGEIKQLISREHTAETRALIAPPEMKGNDKVFSLNSYYQAIENSFPEFASKLALRGVIKYSTVKELLATRDVPGFATLWQSVLDPRELTKYSLLKEKGELKKNNNDGVTDVGEESVFFEDQLEKIKNMTLDKEAQYLLETIPERNPIVEEQPVPVPDINDVAEVGLPQQYKTAFIVGGIMTTFFLIGFVVWFRRKHKQEVPENTTEGNNTLQ